MFVGGQIVQRNDGPDKAQTEMSVTCPAFLCEKERKQMDLLNGKIKPMYFRYLSAAFGSAYSIVDTAGSITARRNGSAGGRCAGLEYYLQSGLADGHRRQRYFQHEARQ